MGDWDSRGGWEAAEQRVRVRVVGILAFLLSFLIVMSLGAEETPVFRLGVGGVVKGDLSVQLYEDGAPIADPGITLSGMANNLDYQFSDLPDVEAGETTIYSWVWEYNNVGYSYTWPAQTRTPQSVINRVSYQIQTNPLEIAAGATLPSASVRVTGLSSDPTGGSVTFTLTTSAGTAILTGVTASLSDIDQDTSGAWEVTLTHPWLTSETSTLSGVYYGRFTLTLPGGGVMIAPPAPGRLQVRVFP